MAILKKILFVGIPVVVLTGCYTDFNPDEYSKPVICINSVVTAGYPVSVSIDRTWRYNEPVAPADREVKDAVISIYVNGELKDSTYVAAEGDEVYILCESEEYGNAEATVTVPYATSIEKVEFIPYGVSVWRSDANVSGIDGFEIYVHFNFDVGITISDVRPGIDYFRLSCETYGPVLSGEDSGDDDEDSEIPIRHACLYMGEFDNNSDELFKEHIGITEYVIGGLETPGLFFTDRMFPGSTYTIGLNFDRSSFEAFGSEFEEDFLDCGIIFTLMTVSRSYYDRMNYLWQKNSGIIGEMADMGFADPYWGYSNVSTGAGVVAAKTVTTYDLKLKDFLLDTIKNSVEDIEGR